MKKFFYFLSESNPWFTETDGGGGWLQTFSFSEASKAASPSASFPSEFCIKLLFVEQIRSVRVAYLLECYQVLTKNEFLFMILFLLLVSVSSVLPAQAPPAAAPPAGHHGARSQPPAAPRPGGERGAAAVL